MPSRSGSDGRHPILCIIPPHMLKEIAEKGTPGQRDWALRTLASTEQFRGQRLAAAEVEALADSGRREATGRL